MTTLVPVWRINIEYPAKRIQLSRKGHYLLTKGSPAALYQWTDTLCWQGDIQPELAHVVVDPHKKHILAAGFDPKGQKYVAFRTNEQGSKLWELRTPWNIRAVHLGPSEDVCLASQHDEIALLDSKGNPRWTSLNTSDALIFSQDGQWILTGGTNNQITCLSADDGDEQWVAKTNNRVTSLDASDEIIVVGTHGGEVKCLDFQGEIITERTFTGEQVTAVGISPNSRYIGVSTDQNLRQLNLTDERMFIDPPSVDAPHKHELVEILNQGSVSDCFFDQSGNYLFISQTQNGIEAYSVYDMGTMALLWQSPKIRLEDVAPPLPPPLRTFRVTPPVIDPRIATIEKLRSEFTDFVTTQGKFKAENFQAQIGVRYGADHLDLYYSAAGYLFTPEATTTLVGKATRLTKHINKVYIVAYDASDSIINLIKGTKNVELYLLRSNSATATIKFWNILNPPPFNLFYQTKHGQIFEAL